MLGIQHTRSSAHHPTTRSAATAAAGPLRTTSKSKRRPSVVQKQLSNTAPTVQNDHETLAEAGGEDDSAWQDIPREEHDEDDEREGVEDDETGEVGEEQIKPALDGASEGAQRAGDGAAEQVKREGEGAESKDGDVTVNYTRHPSSPLSELSPAPDDDESPNQEEGDGGGEEGGEENTDDVAGGSRSKRPPAADAQSTDPANPGSLSSDAHATANASQSLSYPGLVGSAAHQATTASPFSAIHSELAIDGLPPSSPLPGSSSQLPHATSTPPTSSPGKPTGENAQAGPSGLAGASLSKVGPTQKFSILLELNAELFKVCQAFVASGYVPQETPEAQPFSKKLQSNLTWMSAHVDGVKLAAEVPEMDPPVLAPSASHIAFPEGVLERVSNLYAQLSVVFAKDIARRNQRLALSSGTGTPTPGLRNSATPSLLPPSGIGVKRERPDSAGYHGRESPSAAKRRDTGENKGVAGPSTPVHPGSAGSMDMRPPATPGFPTQSHSQAQMQMQMQMARPGSSMGGVRPMSSGGQASGSGDGMFPPNSSPGMGMGSNMQGIAGMGGLSPEAQARARQMQIRQAQAMMYQQQQQQQHQHQQQAHQQQQQQQQQHQQHTSQQQQNLQQHAGMQGGNLAMSPPQRQTQATPSPTQQQQMMQAQAAAARQMSPPGGGAGMGMGMNGSDGMGSSQQGGMSSNMSQSGMNMNGMGANTSSNMTLNPQMIASMGPAAMATYQILQNSQHPMTQYLNQQMPGFSQLPMMDQMRRFQMFQQQRQMAQGQRNQQMMANQMMGGQMRPPNANASGSGASQMQQLGQGGQMGMAPQMQSTNSDGGMQFPGTPTSANMPARTASSMGISQQQMAGMSGMPNIPNMGNLNPQQRQLYLMQMQMRSGSAGGGGLGGGGVSGSGMNPSMMNPQMLAAAQERQRLEQQQQRLALAQRQGSPLNPAANNGRDQFPPGLRSNPNSSVGIARTGRSPSMAGVGDMAGAATPRIGGRMLPGSDDYQRSVLLQQAQRNAQMQQQQQQHQHQQGFMQGQGQGQGGWPGQQQSQQLPLSAGAWPQQNQQVFGMGGSPPNSGMQTVDLMGPPRQTSATPAPMGHHSPTAPSSDFDTMMNW